MDDLQRELNELKEFIADLKADRAATKEKERREAWTKYVSLTVVITAVIAAIASQWSGKYGSRVLTQLNDVTFNQTKASDQWAFYQAKSIKGKIYEIGRDEIMNSAASPEAKAQLAKSYEKQIASYKTEQEAITGEANKFQGDREAAREMASQAGAKGSKMGLAITFFSVSIAMASICLVTKKKPLWLVAMILSAIGIYEMIASWLL